MTVCKGAPAGPPFCAHGEKSLGSAMQGWTHLPRTNIRVRAGICAGMQRREDSSCRWHRLLSIAEQATLRIIVARWL